MPAPQPGVRSKGQAWAGVASGFSWLLSDLGQGVDWHQAPLLAAADANEAVSILAPAHAHTDLVLLEAHVALFLVPGEGLAAAPNILTWPHPLYKIGWEEANPVANLALPPVLVRVIHQHDAISRLQSQVIVLLGQKLVECDIGIHGPHVLPQGRLGGLLSRALLWS